MFGTWETSPGSVGGKSRTFFHTSHVTAVLKADTSHVEGSFDVLLEVRKHMHIDRPGI